MDPEDVNTNEEAPLDEPEQQEKPPVKKTTRRVKPMVEGINAPASSTPAPIVSPISPEINSEVIKPKDLKITIPSGQRSHPVRNTFLALIIVAALGYGGWIAYQKYWPKPTVTTFQSHPALDPFANQPTSNTTTSALSSSTPSTTPPTAPTPPVATGPTLKVNNNSLGYLNVRSQPSSGSSLVTKVYPGQTFPYTETKYDWYHITLPDGQNGWVSGQYITKQ